MTVATGVTATIDTQANAVTLSGSIGGSGNLAKIGSGTLTLTGVQAFTGSARVDAGTLVIGAANTLAGSGTVAVTIAGRDFVDSTVSLDITATGENPFSIKLWSLSGLSPDTNGSVSDFNASSSYKIRIAEFDGGITGFDVSKFSGNTAALNGIGPAAAGWAACRRRAITAPRRGR